MSRSSKTKSPGIIGKYGVRYGSTLRKRIKSIEESQHSKYPCKSCGKITVKRVCVGIWNCKACNYKFAGGAYAPSTTLGTTFNSAIKSLNKK